MRERGDPSDLVLNVPIVNVFVAPQNKYRSDLNWMKGVGWETEGCMNIAQAKKAGDMLSDVSTILCFFVHICVC